MQIEFNTKVITHIRTQRGKGQREGGENVVLRPQKSDNWRREPRPRVSFVAPHVPP
jgi:hypothetical protein